MATLDDLTAKPPRTWVATLDFPDVPPAVMDECETLWLDGYHSEAIGQALAWIKGNLRVRIRAQ